MPTFTSQQRARRAYPSQVFRPLGAMVGVINYSFAAGATSDVTSSLTTVLSTASNSGTAVTLKVAGNNWDTGIKTGLVCDVYATGGGKIADDLGNEIYGKISYASSVYTLSLYVNISGVETAYTATGTIFIDFYFVYQFDFGDFPTNGTLDSKSLRAIGEDPITGQARIFTEAVVISVLNTLPDTTKIISDLTQVRVIVNGQVYHASTPFPAFTVVDNNSLTRNAANAFPLIAVDDVIYEYPTFG